MNPLILTLELEPALATELTAWRTRLFPPERNYLDAHLTLFHALPGDRAADLREDLLNEAWSLPAFTVRLPGPFSLGRGVAIDVDAPQIKPLRARLRERWLPFLGAQDARTGLRPHVTVQNKVDVQTARRTLEEVRASWDPTCAGHATGLALWEYRGGPWAPFAQFKFKGV